MTIRPLIATPSRTMFALPYWIAVHRGFFKDEGLTPDLEFVAGGELINEGMRNGRVTLALGPPDGVMLDALAGGPLRILAGNACKPPLFVMAQPEIRSAAELRGKTFGVLSLREGSSKFIEKFTKTGGLKPGDYKVVEVGGAPARVKLMAERTIDAALQPMPLNTEMEARGFSNLGWTGELEPHYQFTSFNASRDLVQREPALLAAMLRALLRGQRFAFAHRAEASGILASGLGCEQSHALKALQDTSRLGIFDPDMNWSGPGLERIFRNLQEDGAVPAGTRFELERHVLADALRQAQADRR